MLQDIYKKQLYDDIQSSICLKTLAQLEAQLRGIVAEEDSVFITIYFIKSDTAFFLPSTMDLNLTS